MTRVHITAAQAVTAVGLNGLGGVSYALAYDSTNDQMYATNATANLYRVNLTTGAFTLVGATGTGSANLGIAYDDIADAMYGTTADGRLFSVNRTTGAYTLVGATGIPDPRAIEFAP